MKAFRCKNCGRLEHAEHAGENLVPHSCLVCGSGVQSGMDPLELHKIISAAKSEVEITAVITAINAKKANLEFIPENWEVLADCTTDRLAELGLEPHHVCKHTPTKLTDPSKGKMVMVTTNEVLVSADKA